MEYIPYDITGYWAEEPIKDLVRADVVKGYYDTTFIEPRILIKPDNPISRAEFVTLLVRAMSLQDKPPSNNFNAVLPGDWCYKPIYTASSLGIVSGISPTKFEPNRNITRQEICAMIIRAFSNTVSFAGESKQFTDMADNWAKPYINKASAAGIINGYDDGSFRQNETATRAEAMIMISQALKLEKTNLPSDTILINTVLNNIRDEYQALRNYNFDGVPQVTDRYQTGYYKATEEYAANMIKYLTENGVIFDFTLKGDTPLTPRTNEPLSPVPYFQKWASEGAAVPSVKVISKSNRFAEVELTGAEYLLTYKINNNAAMEIHSVEGILHLKKMPGTSEWKIYNADIPQEGYKFFDAYLIYLVENRMFNYALDAGIVG